MDLPTIDTLSYNASLERLLVAGVVSDEQLYDYGTNQALRGVFVSVKSGSQVYMSPITTLSSSGEVQDGAAARVRGKGGDVVLHAMCLAALRPRSLAALTYISKRLLCDAASNFGEGNARPCCREEWTEALSSFRRREAAATSKGECEGYTPLSSVLHVSRKVQLGYLMVLAGTIRLIAQGPAEAPHLMTSSYSRLVEHITSDIMPRVAQAAEGMDDADDKKQDVASGAPSRLTVESNHFIIHTAYWLCAEALLVHQTEASAAKDSSSAPKKNAIRAVLDRGLPQRIWLNVTLVRNALRRGLSWITAEMSRHIESINARSKEAAASKTTSSTSERRGTAISGYAPPPLLLPSDYALLAKVSSHVEHAFTALLKHQERLDCLRLSAIQKYGETSKDYHQLTELMWRHTLRMCMFMQSVAGSWVSTQGGLGCSSHNSGESIVLRTERDVLVYIATCLLRIPQLDGPETESDVAASSDGLLSALVALTTAAPLRTMQAELWSADAEITKQVHTLLVHRALRFKDEQVLRLTTLLSGTILNASTSSASQFVSETSDQLLEMMSDDRDAASHCAVELMTGAIVQRPHVLIPSLFRLFQHGTRQARRNALDVLAGLPQLLTTTTTTTTTDEKAGTTTTPSGVNTPVVSDQKMREIMSLLAEQLLLQLHADELLLRMQSSSLFAKVWPEDVLAPLLNLHVHRDSTGRKQAASQSSLTAIMSARTENADALLLLLQEALMTMNQTQSVGGDGKAAGPQQNGGVPPTTAALQEAEDEGASVPVHRHHPSTPGDVLSHAMLYSTEAIGAEGADQGAAAASEADAKQGSARVGRVSKLVCTLTEVWWDAIPNLDKSQHIIPVLKFAEGERDAFGQQWLTRILTHLVAYATKPGDQSAAKGRVVISSMVEYFMQDRGADVENSLTWPGRLQLYAENAATSQKTSAEGVYATLLPLLCFRACERSSLADPSMAPITTCLWDTLWEPLLGSVNRRRFFDDYPEAQRLLLEVLCRFPAQHFYNRLMKEGKLDTPLVMSDNTIFLQRVALFGFCSYLIGSAASVSVGEATLSECPADVVAVWQHLPLLSEVISKTVLPWILSAEEAAPTQRDAELKKLSISSLDAIALFTISGIQWQSADTVAACEVHALQPLQRLATHYRRADGAGNGGGVSDADEVDEASLLGLFQFAVQILQRTITMLPSHPRRHALFIPWVTRYLHPLMEVANAACASQRGRKRGETEFRVASTAGDVLFHAVMLANKLTPSAVTTATPERASPTTLKLPTTTGSGGTADDAGDVSRSLLLQLPFSDRDALLQFSLGCARYHASPTVQRVGVQLLSALLGSTPELFFSSSPKEGAGRSSSSSTSTDSIHEAFAVLRNIAMVHADQTTRSLAERVLELLSADTVEGENTDFCRI